MLRNLLVQTKIRARFEIRVALCGRRGGGGGGGRGSENGNGNGNGGDGVGHQLSGSVSSTAEVVYGEKLNEKKMGEALGQMVGVDLGGARGWYDAVRRVEGKLLARMR